MFTRKEIQDRYREKNREEINKRHREFSIKPENKIKRREYYKKYSLENKEKIQLKCKKRYEMKKDILLKNQKEYLSNPEVKKHYKQYRLINKDRLKKQQQEWYTKNKDKIKEHHQHYYSLPEKNERRKMYMRDYWAKLMEKENQKRKELGLPLVGEGFMREMEMIAYLKRLFPSQELVIHDRRTLGGLELDAHLPQLKLAFEYQGEQHFDGYLSWGLFVQTQEQMEALKWRDNRKIELCKEKGIYLVHINYNEELSEQLILSKIKELNIISIQPKL